MSSCDPGRFNSCPAHLEVTTMTTNSVDIYFRDLTDTAKGKVLRAAGLTDARDGNWDSLPIFTLDFEVE